MTLNRIIALAVGMLAAALCTPALLPTTPAESQTGSPLPATAAPKPSERPTAVATAVRSSPPTATAAHVPAAASPAGGPLAIRVAGNRFINQDGATVQLRGVNRSGSQYACYEGDGFFDGPTDSASIQAMRSWGINAVRVNLNQHCWLGLADVPPAYAGASYQQAIIDYVSRLTASGLFVIVDMHHSGPGINSAADQQPMADREHSVAYWSSVATAFKSNPAVLFDLFNEPYPDDNRNTTAAWTCVRDGGACPGVPFEAEGMQQLVTAVRATGATNPVLVSGPQYAGVLDRWLEFKPTDPLNQLAASVHIYGRPLGSPYDTPSTWDTHLAPIAEQVPVVIGEVGDTDCSHAFVDQILPWADAHGVSYLAWAWVVSGCADEPSLIKDDTGTPSNYGVGVRDHLLRVAAAPTMTATTPTVTTPTVTTTPQPTPELSRDALYLPIVQE